jgi:hypothetical protein
VWAGIEAARKKLGWSARRLSREAGFTGNNSARYSLISKRQSWKGVGVGTVDKFVDALVRAGISENEIRKPIARTYGMPETEPLLARDARRAIAIARLIRRGYGVNPTIRFVNSLPLDEGVEAEALANIAEDSIKSAVKNGALPASELPPADIVGTDRVHVRRVKRRNG